MFCPHCEIEQEVSKIKKIETLPVLGESIKYEAQMFKCNTCGTEFATTEMEEENFKVAYDLYRDKHHLLRPERIRDIREKYGLGQKNFSRFLGWGEITIHRYESGSLQDIVHNEALVLIDDPPNAMKIFEMNKDRLAPTVAENLLKRIKSLLNEEKKKLIKLPFWTEGTCVPSIESGYRVLDIEKIENVILYIAKKCGGVLKTKLNKLTWYSDFKHFKENAISITGSKYVHLPYGPVPDNYDCLIWKLEKEGRLESQEKMFGEYSGVNYVALANPNIACFSESEMETLNMVIDTLGHLGSTAISECSHKEKAYKMTTNGEFISYSFAKDLSC